MRVAIIHYWLLNERGGEKVLKALLEIYPQADIFTLFQDEAFVKKHFPKHKVTASFLDKIPFKKRLYRFLLPLMPMSLESFDLSGYDLILSSESGPAKGVVAPPNALHVCYCHSPMRYIWDLKDVYLKNMSFFPRLFFIFYGHVLRIWDVSSSMRVDSFVANSSFVAKRIKKYYRRDSLVVHPPVEIENFYHKEDLGFFLIVSELVGYKRVDLAVEAFNDLKKPLIIVGDGPEKKNLMKKAEKNIQFLGKQHDASLKEIYAACRAFVMPALEDFGIVTVEALASGKPVVAYQEGGSRDILDKKTAVLFTEQTKESLVEAIETFEKSSFKKEDCQKRAALFNKNRFKEAIKSHVEGLLSYN